jgi:MbtH protein
MDITRPVGASRFPVLLLNQETFIYAPGGNMNSDEKEDTTIYKVVVNHEEQYSIWRADRENALGWNDGGKTGTKVECLAYIEEVWTDMRPLSLRKQMDEAALQTS